jgi:hypothetical protein
MEIPYEQSKPFKVVPLHAEDTERARLVEAIINRPDYVSLVVAEVERYSREVILPSIMYGTDVSELDRVFKEKNGY